MSNKFQIFKKQKIEVRKELVSELFSNVISNFDSQNILNFSINYQIPLSVVDFNGDTLIHKILDDESCKQNELNKLNFIKFLINQGVGPDIPNIDNIKPIHIACKKQLSLIINYLLEIGVNINFTDNIGNTPIHYFLNGNLYDYVNLKPIELIQPKEYKPDELSFEEKSNLDKFIWNYISDGKNSDIRFFKNTIEKILLNNSDFLEKYNVVLQSINDNQTEKDVISDIRSKHSEITNYLSNLFGNFNDINEIEIHTEDINSWKLNNISGLSIIKNIGDTKNPIQGYLKSKINLNINGLKEIFNINSLFKDDIDFKKYMNINISPIENILKSNKTINTEYESVRKDIFQQKLTGLDTYFGDLISNKSFIGGARTIQLIYPFGINNDANYWLQTKNNNRGLQRGLQNRGGGQLLNEPIYYDLYLLVTNKLFTDSFTGDDEGIKLEILKKIVRRLESIEIRNDSKIDASNYISSIYTSLGLNDYIDRNDELERYFPSNDTHVDNNRNDDKILNLKFKIAKNKQELGEKKLELEKYKNEKNELDNYGDESKTKLLNIIEEHNKENAGRLLELNQQNTKLDNLNKSKFVLSNNSFSIDPSDTAILNQKMTSENITLEELDNKEKILKEERNKSKNENNKLRKKFGNQEILLNFNYDQGILNIEKDNNTNLNYKENERLEINKNILKMSKDNVERQDKLNNFERDLNVQKEASLRQQIELSNRSVMIDLKEEASDKRLEEADKKLEEAKNKHVEAENKRNEAMKIKEKSEKELEDMKIVLGNEETRNIELEARISEKEQEINILNKNLIEQDDTIRVTSEQLEEATKNMEKLTEEKNTLEANLKTQEDSNVQIQDNIKNLQEQISKKAESINKMEESIDKISGETTRQGDNIVYLGLNNLKNDNIDLQEKLNKLNVELEQLKLTQEEDQKNLNALQEQQLQAQQLQAKLPNSNYPNVSGNNGNNGENLKLTKLDKPLEELDKTLEELDKTLKDLNNQLDSRKVTGQDTSDIIDEINEINEINKLKLEKENLNKKIIGEMSGGSEQQFENQLENLNKEIIELQNKKLQDLFDLKLFNEASIKYKYNYSIISKNNNELKTIENLKIDSTRIKEENSILLEEQNKTNEKIKRDREIFEENKNNDLININREISDIENIINVLKTRISDMENKKKELEEENNLINNNTPNEVIELQQNIEHFNNIIENQSNEIEKLEKEVKNLENKSDKVESISNFEEIKAILIQIKQSLDGILIFSNNSELFSPILEITGGAQRRQFSSKEYESFKKETLNTNYIQGDSGVNVNHFDINNLYNLSSLINLKNNPNLSTHQCMKTYHINDIINISGNDSKVICFWIWILLSELEFYEFDANTDLNNLIYSNLEHESIINLARNIYLGETNSLQLDWLKRDFVSDVEKLVYAISLYVDRMPQQPLLTHVSDTIFIIRQQNYDINTRNIRLTQLHIDISNLQNYYANPDSFITDKVINNLAYDPNNVKLLEEVFPSKIKFFINYTNIDNDDDKEFYIKKFVESYLLGLDFLGCFPKIDKLTNDGQLKEVLNPRQSYNIYSNNEYLCDNHGFVNSNENQKLGKYIADRTNLLNSKLVNLNNKLQNADPVSQIAINLEIDEINNELVHISLPGNNSWLSIFFGISNIFNDREYLVKNKDYIFLGGNKDLSNYRLSNSSGLYNFFIDTKNNINNYFKKTLIGEKPFFSVYEEILNLESGYSGSFEQIFKDVYPLLLTLDDMIEDFRDYRYFSLVSIININEKELKGSIDELQNLFKNNRFNLSNFDNYLNNINSFYFMYYYFAFDSDTFKIPKFTYYKIPKQKQNKFKLYGLDGEALEMINFGQNSLDQTTNQDEERDYGINYQGQEGGAESPTGFIHQNDSVNLVRYIDGILKGNKYISPEIINEEIILSKQNNLIPPSIEDNLNEFYKLIVLDLIIKESENIYNELINNQNMNDILSKISRNYNIENNQEKIVYLYFVSKTIEELVSRYFKELINFSANSIFKNLLGGNTAFSNIEELEYINNNSENFNFSLSIIENDVSDYKKIMFNPISTGRISKRMALNLFSFTDEYDEEIDQCGRTTKNDFIIYSNEYTNTDLTKSLQKIIIDVDILEKLLLAGSKIFISNKENKMPIFKILNHYNYKILEKLCGDNSSGGFGISYNYIGSKNYDNPVDYIVDSLNNHANKLLNNEKKLSSIFSKFSFNCFQEINMLLNSDDKFGFNILKNLEFSYQMVSYLINQYLCTYLINVKDVNKFECNFYNIYRDYQTIPKTNNDLAITDLKNEIAKIITKNNNKKSEINNIQSNNQSNNQKTDIMNKLDSENNELQKIKDNLQNENVGINLIDNGNIDNHKIIEKYEDILNNNLDGNRGPFVEVWKEFLNNIEEMKDDCNLLLIRAVIKSTTKYEKNLFNKIAEVLEKASDFNEEYFKEHKYTEVNPTLLFINDLLVFMTKNIICLGLEIFTKKLLLKYLLQKFPEKNNGWYISKINNVFNIEGVRKTTLKDFLYNDISIRLVKNVSMIFKNRSDEVSHSIESVEDIFSEYIGVVQTNGVINISEEDMLIKILKRDVLKYFSLITPSIIKNWQVLCENYMKFYINHFRVIKSHNILKR